MYIVFGIDPDMGEYFGKGETIEEAMEDLETLTDNPRNLRYYKAEEIRVYQTRKFNIIE